MVATVTRTKAALIRRDGYPIGTPAPCYFRCCEVNEIDQPAEGEVAACHLCGNVFDSRGNITPGLLCFWVPGEWSIVDIVGPDGKTGIYGSTLEEVRKKNPGAVIRSLEWVCRWKAKQQDGPVSWVEVTEEDYDRALGCVPPAAWERCGFLVGEPGDHHALSGMPRYQAYAHADGRFFASSRSMTVDEFKAVAMPEPEAAVVEAADGECCCGREIPVGQVVPNYCRVHDGDYSDWLAFNNID